MEQERNTEKRKCLGHKPDGSPCTLSASPGSEYCLWHDPERAEERRAAQSTGGRNGKAATLPEHTPDIQVRNSEDVISLLCETISQVRRGQIDAKIANAVGYLCGFVIRAREQNELESRLRIIEKVIEAGGIIQKSEPSGAHATEAYCHD